MVTDKTADRYRPAPQNFKEIYLRFKPKEKEKLDSRRKLWSLFDWGWAYKRNDGGKWKTDYTTDEQDGKGYGFFKKNHSLNCGCRMCRDRTEEKRMDRKKRRMKNKREVREIMKVIKATINKIDPFKEYEE